MKEKESSETCAVNLECKESRWAWILFLIGIIATIGMRVIQPLNLINPLYGKLAWYVGVLGFFIFFLFKFRADHKRAKRIKESEIFRKLQKKEVLTKEDCSVVNSIFCSLTSKKDRLNFFFIAFFSIVALIIALFFDLKGLFM